MKLGREVSRHNELDNWSNTHRFESVMATKWLLLTISETEPGLWDRLIYIDNSFADRSMYYVSTLCAIRWMERRFRHLSLCMRK